MRQYNILIIAGIFTLLLIPVTIILDTCVIWALSLNPHTYWYLVDAGLVFTIGFPASLFLFQLIKKVTLKERDLRAAISAIKQLESILPMCAGCKKIRCSEGDWHDPDMYIKKYTNSQVSHGLCHTCAEETMKTLEH